MSNEEKESSELIISKSLVTGENIMYIHPNNLYSLKFLQSNTFNFCLIKDCEVSSLTSLCLSHILRVMKYEASVEILVSQPMSVMQVLDSKQIEAHCEHVGFENISTEDSVYTDESSGKEYPTVSVICNKPNRSGEERIEYKKESIIKKNKKIKYGK